MKKLSFLALTAFAAFTLSACGGSGAGEKNDSATTDSAKAEAPDAEAAPAADPKVVNTEDFTINLPEGWERNGKEDGKHKTDLKTNNTVPQYYVTIEVQDYCKTIDKWKQFISKDLKPDGTMTVGDKEFTVMANKDAFYTLHVATILPDDKGALVARFSGDGKKDTAEQKELFKQLLEAVVMK